MRFLVAVDGSGPSDEALAYALDLAGRVGAAVTVVTAVEPAVVVEGGDREVSYTEADDRIVQESYEDAEERARDRLDAAAERAAEAGIEVETELLEGDPVEVVPAFAEAAGVDALFVGHRGLSDRVESMVGSVAKGLVERSTVPVTVVR
jgi:nucleotide-binding universal stress UspA family protein